MEKQQRAIRMRAEGRVQGVAYRAFVVHTAEGLGIRGWVRNRRDGSVEAVLVGHPEAVAEMLECCSRGPPAAKVTQILTQDVPADDWHGFLVRPTE